MVDIFSKQLVDAQKKVQKPRKIIQQFHFLSTESCTFTPTLLTLEQQVNFHKPIEAVEIHI